MALTSLGTAPVNKKQFRELVKSMKSDTEYWESLYPHDKFFVTELEKVVDAQKRFDKLAGLSIFHIHQMNSKGEEQVKERLKYMEDFKSDENEEERQDYFNFMEMATSTIVSEFKRDNEGVEGEELLDNFIDKVKIYVFTENREIAQEALDKVMNYKEAEKVYRLIPNGGRPKKVYYSSEDMIIDDGQIWLYLILGEEMIPRRSLLDTIKKRAAYLKAKNMFAHEPQFEKNDVVKINFSEFTKNVGNDKYGYNFWGEEFRDSINNTIESLREKTQGPTNGELIGLVLDRQEDVWHAEPESGPWYEVLILTPGFGVVSVQERNLGNISVLKKDMERIKEAQ